MGKFHAVMHFKFDMDFAPGAPISAEAAQANADTVALAVERMKAEKLAASLPDLAGMLNEVADMSPELERALNEMIEAKEAGNG